MTDKKRFHVFVALSAVPTQTPGVGLAARTAIDAINDGNGPDIDTMVRCVSFEIEMSMPFVGDEGLIQIGDESGHTHITPPPGRGESE